MGGGWGRDDKKFELYFILFILSKSFNTNNALNKDKTQIRREPKWLWNSKDDVSRNNIKMKANSLEKCEN